MTNPGEFGDFEESFKTAPKAEAGGGGGDLIPESTYKVVLSQQDIRGDGKLVDHDIIKSKTETKGFKIFLEILDPEFVKADKENVKTRGQVVEHVFWVTQKNLPYLKRDIASILGRELKSLNELTTTTWAGLTCEVGIKHEVYQGFKNARVSFINPWSPKKGADKDKEKKPEGTPPPKQPAAVPDF